MIPMCECGMIVWPCRRLATCPTNSRWDGLSRPHDPKRDSTSQENEQMDIFRKEGALLCETQHSQCEFSLVSLVHKFHRNGFSHQKCISAQNEGTN